MSEREGMTLEVATRAAEILDEQGHESSVRPDYSGRGMYGRATPAIETEAHAVMVGWAIACAIAEIEECEVHDVNPRGLPSRSDNMGRYAMVYY